MLKTPASAHRPWRVKRKTGAIRSSKFRDRSSEDLELRTSNPHVLPVLPVSLGNWLTDPGASGK